jgi:hypothetical protein
MSSSEPAAAIDFRSLRKDLAFVGISVEAKRLLKNYDALTSFLMGHIYY